MTDSQLSGAIIGAGFFAGIQAEAWSRITSANIVAVADTDLDRATEFAKAWKIPHVFADAQSLLAATEVDFVDIATRPETHLQLVETAASFGRNCICQKPMAPTWDECVAMTNTCQSAGVRLLIHENWRWQPWYRAAKRAIVESELGAIFNLRFLVRTGDGIGSNAYTVQPYFFQMPRFLIYETLVHHLDTARFLAGEVESVFCQTNRVNQKIAGEDCALVNLKFASGAGGTIDANRINGDVPAPAVFGLLNMECEKGAVRIDASGKIWVRNYNTTSESEFEYRWTDQGYRGDSVLATQQHMIDSLINDLPCESEALDYLKTVALVEACYQSAAENRVVTLDN